MFFPATLGLLAQAATENSTLTSSDVSTSSGQDLIHLLLHANGVVQFTLLLLLAFSIVSWAIIGSKHRQLNNSKKRSRNFYDLFWQAKSIDDIIAKKRFRKSPALSVFKSALESLRGDNIEITNVERDIQRSAENEIEQMEYGVSFLAITASAAPFIGLFGTVWGILNAFWKIGQTGASSLAVVGPHIAEALIATAIGLAAAIPAVIFYNIFVNHIRILRKDLLDFSEDLSNRLRTEYFK